MDGRAGPSRLDQPEPHSIRPAARSPAFPAPGHHDGTGEARPGPGQSDPAPVVPV